MPLTCFFPFNSGAVVTVMEGDPLIVLCHFNSVFLMLFRFMVKAKKISGTFPFLWSEIQCNSSGFEVFLTRG